MDFKVGAWNTDGQTHSNRLKMVKHIQFVSNSSSRLCVFDHFVGLVLKGLVKPLVEELARITRLRRITLCRNVIRNILNYFLNRHGRVSP